MRATLRAAGTALLVVALPFGPLAHAAGKPKALPVDPVEITVEAKRISAFDPREPERIRFGRLEFRGGLELNSQHEAFGGWSSLRLDPTGTRVLAVSDAGTWLTGRFDYGKDGKLAGLSQVKIAAMRGSAGEPLTRIGQYDAESLAVQGTACFVGIEGRHQIRRYDCAGEPFASRGVPLPLPRSLLAAFPRNGGLEALVAVPMGVPHGGSLIAITENGERTGANSLGLILKSGRIDQFRVRLSDGFSITDAAALGRDLLVLERHFSLLRGVAMRLRRIPLATIAPGALVDGEVLIRADRAFQIDNMEGLAVHTNASGETILTMISDDNFSFLQRTIVLQFALVD